MVKPLLSIKNLSVCFPTHQGLFPAVDGVDLTLREQEILGIVGESGSGKSVTMLALMGLVAYPGQVYADEMMFEGVDLLALSEKKRQHILGNELSMIFQEPTSSLNPCFTIEAQIVETLRVHEGGSKKQLRNRAIDLLSQVGIPDPESRLNCYPHQLSGGMNQRVMIAVAIACSPKVLIADEPTTALDVTIQAQILDLLLNLQQEKHMSLIMITHDMGVVAEIAHNINVMYAGQIVEQRVGEELFKHPYHPYTKALLEALPERGVGKRLLKTIPGSVPQIQDRPKACLFAPRCERCQTKCTQIRPELEALSQDKTAYVRCYFPHIG